MTEQLDTNVTLAVMAKSSFGKMGYKQTLLSLARKLLVTQEEKNADRDGYNQPTARGGKFATTCQFKKVTSRFFAEYSEKKNGRLMKSNEELNLHGSKFLFLFFLNLNCITLKLAFSH